MAERFLLSLEQARALGTALRAVPGVADLAPGRYGEVALLFPGERIPGLRFLGPKDDTQIEAHVVAAFDGPPLTEIGPAVQAAACRAVPELTRLDVVIADVAAPDMHTTQ